MKLLINFGAIKTGGGVQLAINYLAYIRKYPEKAGEFYLLLPSSGPLVNVEVSKNCVDTLNYPSNYIERIVFERTTLNSFIEKNQINIIYTFFGAGLPRFKCAKSIVSVAYPIICYPDSEYWKYLSLNKSIKKRIVNFFRRIRIRQADVVIAETEIMANRLNLYVGVDKTKLRIIPPSPSIFLGDKQFKTPSSSTITILVLSGIDRHKNLWRLVEFAYLLESRGFTSFRFILSVSRTTFEEENKIKEEGKKKLLNHYFNFVGSIPADEIAEVYDNSNFLINLSDLESYSNNYMEAWKSGLPLIVNNTDFARFICRKSAVYVNAHDLSSSIDKIIRVFKSVDLQKEMVSYGKKYLAELPDMDCKFRMISEVISEV